jgi:hypothetical protein
MFRFSLATLFVVTTLIAVLVGVFAGAPGAAILAMIFISPLLFIALVATISNRRASRTSSPVDRLENRKRS